ncbi:uncharacterized protein EDB91DRAFT_1259953 [Suillus paluster]|uniref:uncharacterized protein n=1 Tax=Suillus paluster TaxID=48578 RepID=UPI001B885CE7|nr:uncharacterized protein EDB91DRAFT_1259953 [Suillus paluster]KAG1717266.1 hypothetical protein EDB91DRAFT_1259953 [Suillus paluster]
MPLEKLVGMLDHVHNETFQQWYIAYKGRCPGMYPLWNLAALEVGGVSCVTHDSFESWDAAVVVFEMACTKGHVHVL